MRKTTAALALILAFIWPSASAEQDRVLPDTVIPGGHTVGIRLHTDGVIVIGFSPVMTSEGEKNPAQEAGVMLGDRILRINGSAISSTQELHAAVSGNRDGLVVAELIRKTELKRVELKPALSAQSGDRRLGVLIRDSMSGIGTMTFYDPASGLFGALGHGVNDSDTGLLLPVSSGDIIPSVVSDVKTGRSGIPGELHGDFPDSRCCGDVLLNTTGGIFGTLNDSGLSDGFTAKAVPVADHTHVRTGSAQILCNVRGDQVESFEVEIVRLYDQRDPGRNLQLRVTDPTLLALTGGIVQGMSGSPILQDGHLIGAVTHVLINDPKRGYGIYAENMFAEGYGLLNVRENAA